MNASSRRRITRAAALLGRGKDDGAPEFALLNLVDLMLVFAVGLMVARVSYRGLNDVAFAQAATAVVSTPDDQGLEIIVKRPDRIERMKLTEDSLSGQGTRIGSAYRLASGEIVYVPETSEAPDARQPSPARSLAPPAPAAGAASGSTTTRDTVAQPAHAASRGGETGGCGAVEKPLHAR
jgi:hypothetical protein